MRVPLELPYAIDVNSPFIEVLYHRRAVRAYTPEVVAEPRLLALLRAAVAAPTARHEEPCRFVIVQNRDVMKRISDRAKELAREAAARHGNVLKARWSSGDGIASPLADPEYNVFYDAGTLVVICAKLEPPPHTSQFWPEHSFVVADCWLAAENLMLAACADKLGTCCIGFAVPALNDPKIKAEIGIPADFEAIAPIIVGVPAGITPAVPRRPPEVFRWIR